MSPGVAISVPTEAGTIIRSRDAAGQTAFQLSWRDVCGFAGKFQEMRGAEGCRALCWLAACTTIARSTAMTIQNLTTAEDIDGTLELSSEKPVMILKHSTRCPISFAVRQEFETYAEGAAGRGIDCRVVLVVENRALSQDIAARLGVRHQSPQAILLKNGQAVWHDSHDRVSVKTLEAAEARSP